MAALRSRLHVLVPDEEWPFAETAYEYVGGRGAVRRRWGHSMSSMSWFILCGTGGTLSPGRLKGLFISQITLCSKGEMRFVPWGLIMIARYIYCACLQFIARFLFISYCKGYTKLSFRRTGLNGLVQSIRCHAIVVASRSLIAIHNHNPEKRSHQKQMLCY